jgi:hypothetical protein
VLQSEHCLTGAHDTASTQHRLVRWPIAQAGARLHLLDADVGAARDEQAELLGAEHAQAVLRDARPEALAEGADVLADGLRHPEVREQVHVLVLVLVRHLQNTMRLACKALEYHLCRVASSACRAPSEIPRMLPSLQAQEQARGLRTTQDACQSK